MLRALRRREPPGPAPVLLDEFGNSIFTRKHRVEEEEADEEANFVTFRLRVHLKEGVRLVIRDASGSSDPYVKVKYNDKTIYKSNTVWRNLNPLFDEEFAFLIDDPTLSLQFEVFDYDRFLRDDHMGTGKVDLSQLKLFEKHELEVKLEGGDSAEESMGHLLLEVEICPMTDKQKKLFTSRAERGVISETIKRNVKSSAMWHSVVNVILVEAELQPPQSDASQPPDVFAKLKLNSEKYKTKVINKTFEPRWAEQFDFHLDDNNHVLDLMIQSKNTVLGKCTIDLANFEREQTKERWYPLDDDAGSVLLLITISGTATTTTVANLHEYQGNRDALLEKYSIAKSFTTLKDVGHLTVKVYKAEDLASADIGGKSDPFCVLELVNARLQTPTVYKTLHPTWDKLVAFPVKDIHDVLEVSVFDEDSNKAEFLGKIAIPLLKIRNCEQRWYTLKDRKLTQTVKGRICLEMDVLWNPVKAARRTFQPQEHKFLRTEPRFKRAILVNNVNRLRDMYASLLDARELIQSCLAWESYPKSICALVCFMLFTYFFQYYHVPLILLAIFARTIIKHRMARTARASRPRSRRTPVPPLKSAPMHFETDEEEDDTSQSSSSNEKPSSLRGKIAAIQDTLMEVQNQLDWWASLGERARNTFHFTVPFLSYLAIFVLTIATILLFFVPFRWLFMVWGVNKFTKRLRIPDYIEHNELLDFLSRVPSDRELREYREPKTNNGDSRSASRAAQNANNNASGGGISPSSDRRRNTHKNAASKKET